MAQYIPKSALVAEIENIRKHYIERDDFDNGWNFALNKILSFLDTLEVKEVSFAKLSRIAVRVDKWKTEHLWKPADGDDLPEIDREVIALLDNGKVVFAHRPPEYWDGKNIVTGKVTRYYPKTYDKGGWNIPDVKWWLDCLMPKVKED